MDDDDKPFVAWNFMAKEKDSDSEKSTVSLELSLSLSSTTSTDKRTEEDRYRKIEHGTMLCGYCMEKSSRAFPSESSNASTDSDVPLELSLSVDQYTRELHDPIELPLFVDNMLCMEKSSGASSSEPTETNTDSDISLELSLLPSDKKRQTTEENRKLSSTGKKSRVEVETMRMADQLRLGLGLGLGHDPWCIKKKLFVSDISHMARLLVPKRLVQSDILPHWNADQLAQIKGGLQVSFLDCDTNTQYDGIQFKQWREGEGPYVFIKKWTAIVKARELEIDDEIGLYWDTSNSRFNFSVLNRAPTQ
ncbi:hypothetical protein V6N13_027884 [Hibiscus sabdariffa]|uniref:TF-B3 domain-containing protein n=1 Tax=Hibiscus sabdariffa TaxID=183260 RepID=A0ABR2CFW0_9ROSI